MQDDIIHNQFPVLSGKQSNFFEHRKKALRWIQLLSGKEWTDYNTHDPGVTILEALCYTLTEIEYKLDFSIEEILSSSIKTPFNLSNNAFLLAEDVLTTAPVTTSDYRKLIIDQVSEINNVWLIPLEEDEKSFEVLLLKRQHVEIPIVIKKVKALLKKNRAFGLPIMEVNVAGFSEIALRVDIYLSNQESAEEILAQMFFNLNEIILNPNPHRQPFLELEEEGLSYSDIFDGPKMKNGIIAKSKLLKFYKSIDNITIKQILASTKGIEMISNLSIHFNDLIDEDLLNKKINLNLKPTKGTVPFFSPNHNNKINIYKNEELIPVNFNKVYDLILQKAQKTNRDYLLKNQDQIKTYTLNAKNRNIDSYYSIKNDFPHLYGLNENGYSYIQNQKAYTTDQLKAYLLPFEQLLANTFMRLAHTRNFFSVKKIEEEFLHQPLIWKDSRVEKNRINIYSTKLNTKEKNIAKAEENKLKQLKQRNKFLTHLLARFDMHLNHEYEMHSYEDEADHLKQKIETKELMLQKIEELTYNRSIDNTETITSLEQEIYYRIGINEVPEKPLHRAVSILKYNIEEVKEKKVKKVDSTKIDQSIYKDSRIERVKNFSYKEHAIGYHTKSKNVIAELLSIGSLKSSYKIIEATNKKQNYIVLDNHEKNNSKVISIESSPEKARDQVLFFVDKFKSISKKSEGFYLVDHAQLVIKDDDKKFTRFRMSFVFPNWSLRFQNRGFQKEVERIIIKLVPAHVRADFLWLDLKQMTRFENTYAKWQIAINNENDIETCYKLSHELMTFLKLGFENK